MTLIIAGTTEDKIVFCYDRLAIGRGSENLRYPLKDSMKVRQIRNRNLAIGYAGVSNDSLLPGDAHDKIFIDINNQIGDEKVEDFLPGLISRTPFYKRSTYLIGEITPSGPKLCTYNPKKSKEFKYGRVAGVGMVIQDIRQSLANCVGLDEESLAKELEKLLDETKRKINTKEQNIQAGKGIGILDSNGYNEIIYENAMDEAWGKIEITE